MSAPNLFLKLKYFAAVCVIALTFATAAHAQETPPDDELGAFIPITPAAPTKSTGGGLTQPQTSVTATPRPAEAATSAPASPTPEPSGTLISPAQAEIVPPPTPLETTAPQLPPIPQSGSEPNNMHWVVLIGSLLIVGGVGSYEIAKHSKNKKKKLENPDRCAPIKAELDQKKLLLAGTVTKVSLQEKLIEGLKEKAEETVEGKVEEKKEEMIELMRKEGNLVDMGMKGKEHYESVADKIDKAKQILELLKTKQQTLESEVAPLESAYNACVSGDAFTSTSGSQTNIDRNVYVPDVPEDEDDEEEEPPAQTPGQPIA